MKVRFIIVIVGYIALSTIISGCTADYLEYNQAIAALRFEYKDGKDSVVYSFTLHPDKEEDIVEVPYQLMGYAMSADRVVGIEIDKAMTTAVEGQDFSIEKTILASEMISGRIPVTVRKSTALEQKNLVIVLRLCKNESFSEPPINEAIFRIVITNQLTKPDKWPFKEYSQVKHEFVIKVTGVGTDYDKWSGQELVYWTGVLTKALYEYNKNHPGNPLKDENGLLVTF